MSTYKHAVNSEISRTYTLSSKKLSLVAGLGVTIGISIFIFMNSLMTGFNRKSNEGIFKSLAHIRLFSDDRISTPLAEETSGGSKTVILNPRIVPEYTRILDPEELMGRIRKMPDVVAVSPQVSVNVFYQNGRSQISGQALGVMMEEAEPMFHISETMVEGNASDLSQVPNGILIGVGIAQKMNLQVGDNLSLTSSRNQNRVLKVVGIFRSANSQVDKTRSYINLSLGQQLLRQSRSYVTDININLTDPEKAEAMANTLRQQSGYQAEDWKSANETVMAGSKMRNMIATFVTAAILLVAGFGIYNIMNMTISQKINEIAILKAMGFQGGDVVRIFVQQAMVIGSIGVLFGMLVALGMVNLLAKVYIGGDIGYFPVRFEPWVFLRGAVFGLVVNFLAGYLPARQAAHVDPVSIFRK